jgi:hypothetical protein
MSRHSTPHVIAHPEAPSPRARSCTLMVGINEDLTVTAVVGTWNPSTHRYTFVRLPEQVAFLAGETDLGVALRVAAREATLDPEAHLGAY